MANFAVLGFMIWKPPQKTATTGGGWPARLAKKGPWMTVVNRRAFRCHVMKASNHNIAPAPTARKAPYAPLLAKPSKPYRGLALPP